MDNSTGDATAEVNFWADPACPWAWLTANWLLEVEQVRPVSVRFHVMSLAVLNGAHPVGVKPEEQIPEQWREFFVKSLGPVRVLAAVEQSGGSVRDAYLAFGRALHHRKVDYDEVVSTVVAELGLDAALVDAALAGEHDETLFAEHRAGMDPVGPDVGAPVIHVDGSAIFGPVVSPNPAGERAGQVWDAVRVLNSTDEFFELKRTRTRDPIFPV